MRENSRAYSIPREGVKPAVTRRGHNISGDRLQATDPGIIYQLYVDTYNEGKRYARGFPHVVNHD